MSFSAKLGNELYCIIPINGSSVLRDKNHKTFLLKMWELLSDSALKGAESMT